MSTPEGELALRRRRRRKRPRRLLSVELPTAGDASANLYEEPSEGGGSAMMLSLLSTEWMERPLPPMAVLAALPSTAAGRGGGAGGGGAAAIATGPECPPLLVDFLRYASDLHENQLVQLLQITLREARATELEPCCHPLPCPITPHP